MSNGETYKQFKYKEIVKSQVSISYLGKGISLLDTDMMSPYDRELVLDQLIELKTQEAEAIKNANKHTPRSSKYYK